MKFFAIIAILFLIVSAGQAQNVPAQDENDPAYTGQPGCLTEQEVAHGAFPHFRIKIGYWKCSVLGQAAELELCPIAHGFLAPSRACVPWAQWYWTPTVAPPSAPVTAAPEV